MEIVVKARNCDVPSKVKREAEERLAHATRFFDRVLEVEAVFAQETRRKVPEPAHVEVMAHIKGHLIRAHASGTDYRNALDLAMERLERQLARYKKRLTDRRRRPAAAVAAGEAPDAPERFLDDEERAEAELAARWAEAEPVG